jgi:hypothetical protein
MSESLLTMALPTQGEVVLKLPGPLSHQLLAELDQAWGPALHQWRYRLHDEPASAGALEYASWVLASRF